MIVRRVSGIGKGKHIKIDPLKLDVKYEYTIVNKHQLENGRPIKKTINPFQKGKTPKEAESSRPADASRKLNMMDYVNQTYAQALSLEQIKKFQPDFDIGGNLLREQLDEPTFTETLLQLQSSTKWSPIEWTLKDLNIGHALAQWGGGKNGGTQKAKQYLEGLFEKGRETKKHILGSEAEVMMQEALDPETGRPLFDADTFLEEEQIKGIITTHYNNAFQYFS